jgi:hypothetical protein
MVYVGHFSFHKEPGEGSVFDRPSHGHFTTVVEAGDIDEAVSKLEILIEQLHNESDVLDGIKEIYLDACIECRSIPQNGFLTYFAEFEGEEEDSVATVVQGASDEQATAYSFGPDGEDEDVADQEIEPFLVFGEQSG